MDRESLSLIDMLLASVVVYALYLHYKCMSTRKECQMGYLQVRDFPEELHEDLRLLAKREHRSVSQQTIIAIREHVAQASDRAAKNQDGQYGALPGMRGEGHYLERRKKVFERIAATPKPSLRLSTEDIMRTINEGREELDARVGL